MIPYAEFYNYDRLESAAVELGLLNTEADEENLLNLHNQLVWHLYRFDKNHVRMPFLCSNRGHFG